MFFCPDFFGHGEKRLDKKAKVYSKIYDVTNWETNSYNTHIAHISGSKDNQTMKFFRFKEYKTKNIFLEK